MAGCAAHCHRPTRNRFCTRCIAFNVAPCLLRVICQGERAYKRHPHSSPFVLTTLFEISKNEVARFIFPFHSSFIPEFRLIKSLKYGRKFSSGTINEVIRFILQSHLTKSPKYGHRIMSVVAKGCGDYLFIYNRVLEAAI